ncbi:hypothetical protein BOTBODRAFT_34680 [Botryobasidium botryosum FD-172 SS1]|uniref:GDS1 winged helix domain-containing protein n=1 Tax=Botryobasidium botryosum (strain FD-172 SS1) TaxID=930990 RepID=A0A067MCH6_BOTB1|nr:hypothetical protein BOTBODRAFT_34680 [Botryobasidium botryosum FD-172 SS1]
MPRPPTSTARAPAASAAPTTTSARKPSAGSTSARDADPLSPLHDFPPPALRARIQPDDLKDKALMAICATLHSVSNQALCIRELVDVCQARKIHPLPGCTPTGTLNTAIRNHLSRCQDRAVPALLSRHILSGTQEDDRLASALGALPLSRFDPPGTGTGATKKTRAARLQEEKEQQKSYCKNKNGKTRKGVSVWFLSAWTGCENPFVRAGFRDVPIIEECGESLVPERSSRPLKGKKKRSTTNISGAKGEGSGKKKTTASKARKTSAAPEISYSSSCDSYDVESDDGQQRPSLVDQTRTRVDSRSPPVACTPLPISYSTPLSSSSTPAPTPTSIAISTMPLPSPSLPSSSRPVIPPIVPPSVPAPSPYYPPLGHGRSPTPSTSYTNVTPPSPRQYRSASAATTASAASSAYASSSRSVCTTPPSSDDEGFYEDELPPPPPCSFGYDLDLDLEEFDFHFGDEDNDADDDLDDDDEDEVPLLTPRSPVRENIITVKREEFGEDEFSSSSMGRMLFEGREMGLGLEGPCYMRSREYAYPTYRPEECGGASAAAAALYYKSSMGMRFSPSLLPDLGLQISALAPFGKGPVSLGAVGRGSSFGSNSSTVGGGVGEDAVRAVKIEVVDISVGIDSLRKDGEEPSDGSAGMWSCEVGLELESGDIGAEVDAGVGDGIEGVEAAGGADGVDVGARMDVDRDMSHMLGPESVLVDDLDREMGWGAEADVDGGEADGEGSAVEEVRVVTRRYSPGMSVPLVGAQNGEWLASGVKRREPEVDSDVDDEVDGEFGARKRRCMGLGLLDVGEAGSLVVANTCTPLDPPITATILDGMPLFRTTCSSHTLVRRIDTDFVNITSLNLVSAPPLADDVLARLVSACATRLEVEAGAGKQHAHGSILRGTWVPLHFVRELVEKGTMIFPKEVGDVFLGEGLGDLFPAPVPQVRAVIASAGAGIVDGINAASVGAGGDGSGGVRSAVVAVPVEEAPNSDSNSPFHSEEATSSPSADLDPIPMPASLSKSSSVAEPGLALVPTPTPDMDRVALCSSVVVTSKRGRGRAGAAAACARPRRSTRSMSGAAAPVQVANARARTLRSGRNLPT